MNNFVLIFLDSASFIGIFLLAIYFLIPKAIKFWKLWRESKKTIHLSNAIACGIVAVSFLLANLALFLKAILGG